MKKIRIVMGIFKNPHGTKLIRTMKLICLLLTFALIQVSAETYSQAKKFTLKLKDTPLAVLFQEIEKSSEFRFFYDSSSLDLSRKVTITAEDSGIDEVLETLFRDLGISHEINDRYIIVKKISGEALGSKNLIQQRKHAVSGKVTDTNKLSLPGVTIIIKGSSQGTVTDPEGNYSLTNVPEDATLVFSFVGMKTQEVVVGSQAIINIGMEEESYGLDEVVAIGYGVQKRINLTGAVDVIENTQIQDRQSPTVSQLLQGQAPGLNFTVNDFGFQPGATMDIEIRGMGSLNGGSPYVLVDGIPGDMNHLNPEDIESVSILKDAAASAIYGARAPYGVILITTKSGKREEKINITYSGSLSFATPQNLPKMLSSVEEARVSNEAGNNGGGRPFTNEIIDRMYAYIAGDIDYLKQFTVPDAIYFETMPRSNGTWGFNNYGNANYDWFDEYYGSAVNQQHNFSIRGGSKTAHYYLSAGYLGQEGVLNYGHDTFDRTNILGKVHTSIAPWWDINYQIRFMRSMRILPNMDKQGSYDLIFHQIARTNPMNAKYDGYGNIMIQSKIPWVNDAGTDNIETTENIHTFSTEMRPLKGWKVNADFSYRSTVQFRSNQELSVYDHLVDKSVVVNGNTNPNSIQQYHYNDYYWTSNIYTSYSFSLANRHNFDILAGIQYEYSKNRNMDALKNNLIVQNILSLQTATGVPSVTESLTHWSTQGYFGRFSYNYMERYLFEANIRRDGTSRFRDGNRWGVFPSLAFGWNVHREHFWEPVEKAINTLKFRASWGQLGNQNVNAYQDMELIPLHSDPLNWIFGYGQTRPIGYTGTPALVSPNLSWETATTNNFGVNMTFLNNRLHTDFDWFERNTTHMIGPAEAQPGVMGAELPQENNSTLRTRGWEVAVRWKQNLKNGMSYFVSLNLFDNKTVVTKYLNPTGILSTWYVGREQGEIWGYTANDLYRTQEELNNYVSQIDLSALWGGTWKTGDVKYEDINGDKKVNNGLNSVDDHGDLSIIGNSSPHYQFGISPTVSAWYQVHSGNFVLQS